MSQFPVTVKGLDELLVRLKNAPANIIKAVDIELKDGSEQIAKTAKLNAPGNNGTLQQGIGSERGPDPSLDFNVYSNAEYSGFVEFGTGTYVSIPPGLEEYAAQFRGTGFKGVLSAKEAIFQWCRQKGIEEKAWYPIYIAIMTNGVHPQPFFFSALAIQEPVIIKNVTDALSEAI